MDSTARRSKINFHDTEDLERAKVEANTQKKKKKSDDESLWRTTDWDAGNMQIKEATA